MQVQQGPLPYDNSVVDPSTFLEAWIAGTTVWDFGPETFVGGTLQFVISQTEAPAASIRHQGMLWFKRGEGRLYMWDKPDLPSGLTFSDTDWVAVSDRREMWVYVIGNAPKGAPLTFRDQPATATQTETAGFITATSQQGPFDNPVRPIWVMDTASNGSGATNKFTEVIFIAMDTATSGTLIRAVELGFCDGLFISGATGAAGAVVIDDNVPGWFGRIDPTCGSACRYMPIAECGQSYADPVTEGTRRIFKHMMPLIGIGSAAGV